MDSLRKWIALIYEAMNRQLFGFIIESRQKAEKIRLEEESKKNDSTRRG